MQWKKCLALKSWQVVLSAEMKSIIFVIALFLGKTIYRSQTLEQDNRFHSSYMITLTLSQSKTLFLHLYPLTSPQSAMSQLFSTVWYIFSKALSPTWTSSGFRYVLKFLETCCKSSFLRQIYLFLEHLLFSSSKIVCAYLDTGPVQENAWVEISEWLLLCYSSHISLSLAGKELKNTAKKFLLLINLNKEYKIFINQTLKLLIFPSYIRNLWYCFESTDLIAFFVHSFIAWIFSLFYRLFKIFIWMTL